MEEWCFWQWRHAPIHSHVMSQTGIFYVCFFSGPLLMAQRCSLFRKHSDTRFVPCHLLHSIYRCICQSNAFESGEGGMLLLGVGKKTKSTKWFRQPNPGFHQAWNWMVNNKWGPLIRIYRHYTRFPIRAGLSPNSSKKNQTGPTQSHRDTWQWQDVLSNACRWQCCEVEIHEARQKDGNHVGWSSAQLSLSECLNLWFD